MYPDDSEPVRGCDADRGDPGPASRAADSMMAAYAAGGGRPTWDAEEGQFNHHGLLPIGGAGLAMEIALSRDLALARPGRYCICRFHLSRRHHTS